MLILVASSLALMLLICLVVVGIRENIYVAAEVAALESDVRFTQADIEEQVALIRQQGVRPELAVAALASFLKAAVVSAMTILISTFASSSLFTIITSILLFLIGHAHALASNYWLTQTEGNLFMRLVTKVVKLLVPDFQLFSFSEGIVVGEAVVPHLVWGMALLTAAYLVVFLLISQIIFVYKEF